MATWKPVSDCMFAVIKMELSVKSVYGPVLKITQLSAHAQNHAIARNVAVNLLPWSFSATTIKCWQSDSI